MKASNVKRDYYIDNLKAVLILLVVIAHFSMCFDGIRSIGIIKLLIYVFHMPCFVFVSGYLAKSSFRDGKLRSDKIFMFIWLYFVLKIGMAVVGVITGGEFDLELFRDSQAPWYLICMAVWYLMIPFLMSIKPKVMIILSFLTGILIGYLKIFSTTFSMSRIFVFLPFFVIGLYLSEEKFKKFLSNRKLRIAAIVFMIAVVVLFFTSIDVLIPYLKIIYGGGGYTSIKTLPSLKMGGVWRAGWYVAACVISAAFMMLIPKKLCWFSKYGSRTLQIFILHILIRNLLNEWHVFDHFKGLPEIVNCMIVWGGSVGIVILLGNRWFKKLFDVLSGGAVFKKILK